MSKKWISFIITGFLCCGVIGFAVAKQNPKHNITSRDRAKLELRTLERSMHRSGETPDLLARKAELQNQLNGALKNRPNTNAPANQISTSAKATALQAASSSEVDNIRAAKAAQERIMNGEMRPGDKALVEAYLPVEQGGRQSERSLDDNGGDYFSWAGSLAIPDGACPSRVTSVISVAGAYGPIQDVEVIIDNITHTWDSDLQIYLIGPNSVEIELSTNNGSSGDNYVGTVFDDEAATSITAGAAPFTGSFQPEGLLSTFDGISPVGDWTLSICDAVGSDLGTLTGWQIQILAPVLTGPELTVTDLYPCGDNEPNPFQLISLRVNNLGSVASDPTTAHFDYDGGTTTGSLAVPAIAPGGFFDVNFIAIIDLTAGPHTLVGSVDPVAGEANTANNTETCVPVGFQCYDQVVVAPGSWTEETIGDECTLRSGADYVFEVVIPYDASWSFSLCNGGSTWDTYLYLSSSCCGTILNSNDDYCGLVSQLSCIQLTTGVYFVDVEPFSSGGLGGTFTLDIFECIPGACCYGAGQCTEIPEEDCIALGGTFQGDGTLCSAVECPNPCIFECDVNAAAEGDDFTNYCETDGASDFNGGCNLDPPAYTEIQCGDIVCGNAFTCDATQVRDTDWYRFTTTGWNDVTVTAQAAFNNFVYGIVDISDCGVPFFISVGTITDCSLGPQSVTALTLPPGTYAVLGLYGDFTGLPVPSQYQLTLGCTPVAAPTGRCCYFDGVSALCATNTLEECDLLGGLWVSGIDCDTPCEIGRCCYNAGASCGDVTQAECDFLAGTWDEFLTCTSDPCPVPVDNDDCETAEEMVVVPGGSVTVLSGAAGATYTCTDVCTDDCGTWTSSSPDQFYFFTLTECRKIAIVTDLNAVHDSHISVYNDGECCGTPVLCNDDWGCNFSLDTYDWLPPTLRPLDDYGSEVAGLLEAGTYYIRAGHYSSGNWGEYELSIYDFGPCVNAPCDPINDLTAYPIPTGDLADHIQLMWTAPQDEDYTVWSTTNPNNDGNPDNGADADWVLEATLLGLTAGPQTWDGPATFGTLKFYVVTAACEPFTEPVGRCCYDGVCADLTHAACNDLGGVWTLGLTCVSDPCPVVPDNDDCIGAIEVLNGTPVSGSTALAVVGTDITSCTFNDIYDVWYYYVATTTDPIWVTLCDAGTTFDTGLAVFDACGGTEVACNDDDFITLPNLQCDVNGFASTLEFTPAAVGIFYIRVSGYDGDTGDFVLNVTQ